jgi:hypothetical protein
LIDKGLDRVPELKKFLSAHANGLRAFLLSGIALFFLNYFLYMGSLGPYEEETKSSIKSAKVNVVLWSIFWVCWGCYCAHLFSQPIHNFTMVRGSVIGLVIIPSFTALVYSERLRRQILKQEAEESDKDSSEEDFEPYIVVTKRKLFAGYYSILSVFSFVLMIAVSMIFGTFS